MSVNSLPENEVSNLKTKDSVVYRVVLTGGPCAGKTTALARFRTFFENLGWKVYCVPEAATILLGGGVKFSNLSEMQADKFQENVLLTILQLEKTYFDMAAQDHGNCLVVCDRGAMDASAFCTEEMWQEIMKNNDLDYFALRDGRYNQIVHLETAAKGAEMFYQLTNNATRGEDLDLARERDTQAAQAWVGHPYCDVIDNSTDFDGKMRRAIEVVCKRLGKRLEADVDDRLKALSKKRKFHIKSLPTAEVFPSRFQDFEVQHDYLLSNTSESQLRVRKRGQKGSSYTYTLTERKFCNGEKVELLKQLPRREYDVRELNILLKQKDPAHFSIHKTRRCFHWGGHYFQLDIFNEPCSPRCRGLILLETYTTKSGKDLELPSFLEIVVEVTNNESYSMFNLSQMT